MRVEELFTCFVYLSRNEFSDLTRTASDVIIFFEKYKKEGIKKIFKKFNKKWYIIIITEIIINIEQEMMNIW